MKRRSIIEPLLILFIVIILVSSLLYFYKSNETAPEPLITEETEEIHETEYGIVVDSLKVFKGTIRRNQFLGNILSDFGVNYDIVDQISRLARPVFDVRNIRAGNSYALITTNDLIKEALFFIYEESPISYIVFSLDDSLHVYRESRPVTKLMSATSGVIESSLWNAMIKNGDDPELAAELSEVFAWTVDFFGLQKGDYYKAFYEEMLVDGQRVGTGKIQGAFMRHGEKDYYAFYFVQGDKKGEYFDEKGQSLRREFLKAPLNFRRISSHFTHSRYHPVLKIRRPHHGIDYAADYGTPVVTIGNGTVLAKGWDPKGGGNYLKIRHNSVYTTVYMHLSKFAKGLQKGGHVSQGEVIGYVGSSGLSTGPHLDFRVFKNGSPIDPLKVESPPAEPVSPQYINEFIAFRDSLSKVIDSIPVTTQSLISNR